MSYHFLPRPAASSALSLDFSHLQALGRDLQTKGAGRTDRDEDVAMQFEALLVQQILKHSRQSSLAQGFLDSAQTRLAEGLHHDQVAMQVARPGLGLAQVLVEQMRAARGELMEASTESREQVWPGSRLPHLRSDLGHHAIVSGRRQHLPVANSISELLDLLQRPARLVEQVAGVIGSAPGHIRAFVERMGDAAYEVAQQTGLPTRLILGQAALESGWGRREIRGEDGAPSHNLFGIKATGGWEGKVVNVMTTEYGSDGTARKVSEPFRAYGSYAESLEDYARLLTRNRRYREVLSAGSAEEAAQRIQEAGYATDPSYADKLISIMAYFVPEAKVNR